MRQYFNPVIPGCYPDPSICRVKDHYYLVASSFEYFPGIPIFESIDLINWRSLGCVLNRPEQVDLKGSNGHSGIFAPTIRYYGGMFYVVATNVSHGGHFIVKSKDPRKGWSNPIYINQEGIDPSLYFERKTAYLLSTAKDHGKDAILISKVNLVPIISGMEMEVDILKDLIYIKLMAFIIYSLLKVELNMDICLCLHVVEHC